jgi:hypothetical protein
METNEGKLNKHDVKFTCSFAGFTAAMAQSVLRIPLRDGRQRSCGFIPVRRSALGPTKPLLHDVCFGYTNVNLHLHFAILLLLRDA